MMKSAALRFLGFHIIVLLGVQLLNAVELDPRDLHRKLRERTAEGLPVAALVIDWKRRRLDHSFDSFLENHPLLPELTRKLIQAMRLEKNLDLAEARRLFHEVASRLEALNLRSEAAFAYYYAAELAQSELDFKTSLSWLDRARSLLDPTRPQPYLEAVLLQGRGYSLWYLDQLQPGIQAFEAALERYRHFHLADGIVATWNNLAVLNEELELPGRARINYERAFSQASEELSPEVSFQLNSNYAFFLARHGPPSEIAPFLENARRLQFVNPFEFALLECRLTPVADTDCNALVQASPVMPSQRIERQLTLSRYGGSPSLRRERLDDALRLAEEVGSSFWLRKVRLELGELLEEEGKWIQAARLYRRAWLEQRDVFERQAVYYPYRRAVAPLFAGRVRALIRSGQSRRAWVEIQDFSRRRQARLAHLPADPQSEETAHHGRLLELQAAARDSPLISSVLSDEPDSSQLPQPRGFEILEMWPDGNDLFTWVFQEGGWRFRTCPLSESLRQLLDSALEPLRGAEQVLPREEPLHHLKEVYENCLQPLLPRLSSGRIAVIPHNESQSLSLEVVPGPDGYLGRHFAFSYLPRWKRLEPRRSAPLDRPLFVPFQGEFLEDWEWLQRDFPRLRRLDPRDDRQRRVAPWIHLASHFKFSGDDWFSSGLETEGSVPLQTLLNLPLQSDLLSLAMCDGGDDRNAGNPYWLGLAEILLERKTRALLLSRWKLDEFSLEIYRGVLRRMEAGEAVDLALLKERRAAARKQFLRDGSMASGRHPFFWAGITFVGHPDWSLSAPQPKADR